MNDYRLLIVDDDRAIRETVRAVLEDEGFTVAVAANGAEAIAKMEERPPRLVLLDLMMPVVDGWRCSITCARIRRCRRAGVHLLGGDGLGGRAPTSSCPSRSSSPSDGLIARVAARRVGQSLRKPSCRVGISPPAEAVHTELTLQLSSALYSRNYRDPRISRVM